jgi:hypothetical protein
MQRDYDTLSKHLDSKRGKEIGEDRPSQLDVETIAKSQFVNFSDLAVGEVFTYDNGSWIFIKVSPELCYNTTRRESWAPTPQRMCRPVKSATLRVER